MAKVRFVFGKEMTDEQMWEAFKKMAKECGIPAKDVDASLAPSKFKSHNLKKSGK